MEANPKLCQCCGMPLSEEVLGTNADGSKNEEYCMYCLENGKVKYNSMEDLIKICVPILEEQGFTDEQAKSYLADLLPKLKHWTK